jgi:hypothetical protein
LGFLDGRYAPLSGNPTSDPALTSALSRLQELEKRFNSAYPSGSTMWANNEGGLALAPDSAGNFWVLRAGVTPWLHKISGGDGSVMIRKTMGGGGKLEGPTSISRAIAAGPAGEALVTGSHFPTSGGQELLVFKVSGVDGSALWSRIFSGSLSSGGFGVAVNAAGDVVVTGSFEGTLTLDGYTLTSAGEEDVFVAKLSRVNGIVLWAQSFGDASFDQGNDVAFDPQGDILLTGDGFVSKLDGTTGAQVWHTTTSEPRGSRLAVDANGDVFVTFGLKLKNSDHISNEITLAKYSGGNGARLWFQDFRSDLFFGGVQGPGIAVDVAGNVLLTGSFDTADLNLGGGPMSPDGAFVAKFAGLDGSYLWSRYFRDAKGWDVAVDANGSVIVTGAVSSAVDFGRGFLLSDEFLLKLSKP